MKRLNFRIIHHQISEKEKMKRIKQYNDFTGSSLDYNQFNQPMFDDFIDMNCSKCGYSHLEEAEIILECFDKYSEPYPCINCPNCGEDSYIPDDVFSQLNNLPLKKLD